MPVPSPNDEKPFLNLDIGIKEVRLLYDCIESYAESSSTLHPSEKERLTKLRNLYILTESSLPIELISN